MVDRLIDLLRKYFAVQPIAGELMYWEEVYAKLDAKYYIGMRGVSLALFMSYPLHYERWIRFYFDNLALFNDRMGLRFFITNDPDEIVKTLMNHPQRPEVADLLCSSQQDLLGDGGDIDIPVRVLERKPMRDITCRDGRYIQPVNKHRINPRYKRIPG